jgi:peptidoglycan/LPS O-acetylase OafA/YrhL
MVKNELHNDGFYDLLILEQDIQLPAHLEMSIMHEVELLKKRSPIPIKLSAIFSFGLLTFLYVIVALLSTYYYPTFPIFSDIKMLIGLGIIVQVCYELNEFLPTLLENNSTKNTLNMS